MIKRFNELLETKKDYNFLILGAGKTLSVYQDKIRDFITQKNTITIGVNNMTHIFTPDIHVWGNNGRLRDFGNCIKPESTLIIGSHILKKNIKKWDLKNYYLMNYTDDFDDPNEKMYYDKKNDTIHGFYRTLGNVSIVIAHLMGAKNIYMVGVDGYSNPYNGDQHCYGSGLTDSSDMEYEKDKDNKILFVLRNIKKNWHDFKILTKTVYGEFYDSTKLY